jgi:DNA-binding NarL/FixJ family response regulator
VSGVDSVTIVIADDHPMFRAGLRDRIERNTAFHVIGEAANGEEAYTLLAGLRPDIAILDIEMPKLTGLEVAARINAEELPVSVVILTMYQENSLFNQAIDAGVKGYILKESAVQDILGGIAKVAAGEYYFSAALSGYLVERSRPSDRRSGDQKGMSSLTPTEHEVLRHISYSLSSREIAAKLNVSTRTIETHRYNIAQKLGLTGSYALLRFALENRSRL